MRRRVFLLGSMAAIAPRAHAAKNDDITALSGDRFRVQNSDFQLADILAPSQYVLGETAEPAFEEARKRLEYLLMSVDFEFEDAAEPTRWGERLVRTRGRAPSLEEVLVADGAARVAPQTNDTDFISRLLEIERNARSAGKGLWALKAYQVFDAENAQGAIGGYHLAQGEVVSARKVGSRAYLNFGDDYRTDFTASAASSIYRRWVKAGFDIEALQGAIVRVRGFVIDLNGPSIDLIHAKQVELIDNV